MGWFLAPLGKAVTVEHALLSRLARRLAQGLSVPVSPIVFQV
jgi:hypothetical protein